MFFCTCSDAASRTRGDEVKALGVGRVVQEGSVLDEAVGIGKGKRLSVIAGKEAVNASLDVST